MTRNKRQEEPPLPPLSSPFRFHLLASALVCGHTPPRPRCSTRRTVVNQKARLSRKFSSRSETGVRKESSQGAARRTMPRGRGERGERDPLTNGGGSRAKRLGGRKRRSRGINHGRRKLKATALPSRARCLTTVLPVCVSPFFFSPPFLLFFLSDLSSGTPGPRAFSEAWRGRDK